MATATDEILTPKELAERLQFSVESVYRMVEEGAPVLQRKRRGKMRFVLSEVMAWMRTNRGTTPA